MMGFGKLGTEVPGCIPKPLRGEGRRKTYGRKLRRGWCRAELGHAREAGASG